VSGGPNLVDMATDFGELYRANAEAVTGLAFELSDDELATRVPATPEWTVHQVLAHVAGGAADILAGRMDDAPSPRWSARHVAERTSRSTTDLVTELQTNTDAVVASIGASERPAVAFDLAVHHADLREALGRDAPPERLWRPVLDAMVPRMLGENADDVAGVPPYELFRAIFSRRSRAQMTAWDISLEPATLDGFCVFGPRDDDQPIPTRPA
jgi:uncharacterized protein (TIGR03083 family)